MGLTLPADMAEGATIKTAVCTGVTDMNGKSVPMAAEYAKGGLEPAIGAACSAAGVSASEAHAGAAHLKLVGGQDHAAVASIDLKGVIGHQAAVETQNAGAPMAGMAAGKAPDGPGRG